MNDEQRVLLRLLGLTLAVPTVERLAAALRAYPGALLLVTHDEGLADACTTTRWEIEGRALLVR